MRITIHFTTATTDEARSLSVAALRAGCDDGNRITLGVEGPEHWGGKTPQMTPEQFARFFSSLVGRGPFGSVRPVQTSRDRPIDSIANAWETT